MTRETNHKVATTPPSFNIPEVDVPSVENAPVVPKVDAFQEIAAPKGFRSSYLLNNVSNLIPKLPEFNTTTTANTSNEPSLAKTQESNSFIQNVKEAWELPKVTYRCLQDCLKVMLDKNKMLAALTITSGAVLASVPILANKINSLIPNALMGENANNNLFLNIAQTIGQYSNALLPDSLSMGVAVASAFFLSNTMALLNSGSDIATKIASLSTTMFAPTAENHIRAEAARIIAKIPSEERLSQENRDRTSLIHQGLFAFQSFFSESVKISVQAVALVGTTIGLFSIPGFETLGLTLAISSIPIFFTECLRNIESVWVNKNTIHKQREVWLYDGYTTNVESLDHLLQLRSLEPMLDIAGKRLSDLSEDKNIIYKRAAWSAGIMSLYRVGVTAYASLVALNVHTPGPEGLSNTLYALGMVSLFQGALYGLTSSATHLFNLSAQIAPFYKMKDEVSNKLISEKESEKLPEIKPLVVGSITFSGVTKSFNGKVALSVPDLTIKSGEIIGICGKVGSGKSVFSKLIAGRLKPTEGSIHIQVGEEKINLADIDQDVWNATISNLDQKPFLSESLSIREFIELARNKLGSDLSLEKIAEQVGLGKIIPDLPEGYDTKLGYGWIKGWNPSGGQAHLMQITQNQLSDSPIIILDEPTSDLDVETAKTFRQNLRTFLKETGKTAIVISHTFSDLEIADRLLVFEDSRIVATGTPAELSQIPGFYRDGNFNQLMSMIDKYGYKVVITDEGSLEIVKS